MRKGTEAESRLRRLGDVIARHRITSGKTQEEVAHAADLSEQFLRRVERGRGNPSYLSLLAIARGLEVSLLEIIREATAADAGDWPT